MFHHWAFKFVLICLIATISGCGGGGGDSGGGTPPQNPGGGTPPPVVTSTFVATDTTTVQVPATSGSNGALTFTGMANVNLMSSQINIGLDSNRVPVTAEVNGVVPIAATNLISNGLAYAGTESLYLFRGDVYGAFISETPNDPTQGLHYSNYGVWQLLLSANTTGTYNIQEYAGGTQLTLPANMPVMNLMSYTGSASTHGFNGNPAHHYILLGSPLVSITVNYAAGTISGSIGGYSTIVDAWSGASVGGFNSLTLNGTINGNSFSGTVTAVNDKTVDASNVLAVAAGTTGNVSGKFYGPAANEITGVYIINTTTSNGQVIVTGSFGVKQ